MVATARLAALSALQFDRGPNRFDMSLGKVATLASISASASGSAIGHVRPIVLCLAGRPCALTAMPCSASRPWRPALR